MWMTLLCFTTFGQSNEPFNKRWGELNKGFKYEKSKRYKGPKTDYIYPAQLSEDNSNNEVQYNPQLSDENVIYSREKHYKNGDNNGVKKNIKKNESKKIDDLEAPDSDAPKIDYPNWRGPNWDMRDGAIVKLIFTLIIIALLAYLIYYFFFKNKSKSDKNINAIDYNGDTDINPEVVQEKQLLTELEKAILEGDFRLAVRLYYVLLLKTLIEKDWIKWAKRKTNTHYLIEMSGHRAYEKFNHAVRIFEWSWYGKNKPSPKAYQRFSKFFDEFLDQLKVEK